MITNIPHETFSKEQHRKAKTCVVTVRDEGHRVWNPETDTIHTIINGQCDCTGFRSHGSCYHNLALSLWKKRNEGLSYEEAVAALFVNF